jgi:hypothetical protein
MLVSIRKLKGQYITDNDQSRDLRTQDTGQKQTKHKNTTWN